MIHNSASSGYQRHARTYASARPSYHPELLRFFAGVYRGEPKAIVELGAGTGIFTQQLVEAGYAPTVIEPVAEMRAELALRLPMVDVRDGTAEHTGLADNSVDAVAVAQAFHWFNYEQALTEIRRVLRPGGLLACFWNVRDVSVDWVRRYEEVVNRYEGETPRHSTMRWRRAIAADSAFEFVSEWSVPNPQPSSPEKVRQRALSTSFIAALPPPQQQQVLEEVRAIVEPLGTSFEFPYNSQLQVWRLL